jgi:LysM repeat protein
MEPLNLVNMVSSYLTGDVGNKLATFLGESRERTQSGVDAAIPGILSGFDRVASTPEGARRLSSTVDSADSGILSNLAGMFGGGGFSADTGGGLLRSLFGGERLSELGSGIGRSSGLSGKAVTTLLGFLGPVALGVLKHLKSIRGLDASGLASLLSSQRSNIAAAMPEGMRRVGTITEPTYTREPLRDVTREAPYQARPVETYPHTGEPRPKSSLGWLLPLLVAGLVGLIWYGAARSGVRAARDEGGLAERTARTQEMYRHGAVSFESLKSKYQTVIQEARNQGIQISKLQEKDGKLLIEGTAPSSEAANRVWDQIKRIDPNMDGIIANFPVNSSVGFIPTMPSPAGANEATAPDTSENAVTRSKPEPADMATTSGNETSGTDMYTVKRGDTLGSISKHFYGTSKEYMRIVEANKDQISNRNVIKVGQELHIPAK